MNFDAQTLSGFSRHLKILQALSDASVAVYCRKIEDFAAWMEKKKGRGSTVGRSEVEDYLEACFYGGNSNATRLSKLVAIKKFFRYLMYAGLPIRTYRGYTRPRLRKKFVQKFTKQEVVRVFAASDPRTESGLRDVCIMMLAVFCGLRAGEIIGLTLQDIIDVGKSFDVHVTGKFSKERQVYLWKVPSDILRQFLSLRMSQRARANGPLFVSYRRGDTLRGNRLTLSMLDTICKKYAAAAGIHKPKISMHMFRATHASDLRHIAGYDTPAIAERLGHENISTTDSYLPSRARIHKVYPSMAVYWKEFKTVWKEMPNAADGSNGHHGGAGDAEEF
jgi:site-specific recombinase XerD